MLGSGRSVDIIFDGTRPFVAETESFPDHQSSERKVAEQNFPDKGFRVHPAQGLSEGRDDQEVYPELFQDVFLVVDRHDPLERNFGRQNHERVGIECQDGSKMAEFPGFLDKTIQESLVPDVDTVKISDGKANSLVFFPIFFQS